MPMSSDQTERTILVTGVNGQVGHDLVRSLQGVGRVVAVGRKVLDLSNLDQVRTMVREARPALIVNSAAYTAVDKAESEYEVAMRINGEAPGVLAEEAKKLGAALIHYSTDYVFDGQKEGAYVEEDVADPLNAYGRTKLAGEQAIAASGVDHLVFRTSWVYGTRGKSFLLTMLRLAAEKPELKVVADQFGAPTWSNTIASLTAHVVAQASAAADSRAWWDARSGIYHMTASDSTSWCGFASEIFALANLEKQPKVLPILSSEYPAQAKRPLNSRMSNEKLARVFGLRAPRWDDALRLCMEAC